jgi:hypothetical protein
MCRAIITMGVAAMRRHLSIHLILAASVPFILGTSTTEASGGKEPPRYRLEVGQELTYRGTSDFRYERGSFGDRSEWSVWVVRRNDDGGWRLVVRSNQTSINDGKTQGDPDLALAWFDLTPDGTIAPNDSWGYRFDPTPLFPKLPKDIASAERGWEDVRVGRRQFTAEGRSQFRVVRAGKDPEEPWTFEEVRTTPLDPIYLFTFKYRYTFDPRRGAISRVDKEDSQGWTFVGKGTGTTELVEVKRREADFIKTLAVEADRYFAADKEYLDLAHRAAREPLDSKEILAAKATDAVKKLTGRAADGAGAKSPLLDEAGKLLERTLAASTLPAVRERLEAQIKQHKQMASYYRDGAIRRAEVVGKAAAEWETKDLDGKPHALKD